jgi:hypothetical protein
MRASACRPCPASRFRAQRSGSRTPQEPTDACRRERLSLRAVRTTRRVQLDVELVGRCATGLKGPRDEVLQALDDALGLRVRRLAEVPVDAQLSAERRVFLPGATLAGVQPGLVIPDQQLRKRAQRREDQRRIAACVRRGGIRTRGRLEARAAPVRTLSGPCRLSSSDGRRSVPRSGASSNDRSTPQPRWCFRASSAGDRARPPRAPASSPNAEPAPAA